MSLLVFVRALCHLSINVDLMRLSYVCIIKDNAMQSIFVLFRLHLWRFYNLFYCSVLSDFFVKLRWS